MTNMRFWDQLKTTDPRHTKKVEFGRKFTSIDAHWQLQRMTEVFGPIGQGWGYHSTHSIENLSATMIIAVCDVTIWWRGESDPLPSYGPVRGTCEMWSQERYKGKLQFEEDDAPKMRLDDDAPKKAMTDALTKGLSHLGVSADVFLGLYDDNKYVQRIKEQFATGSGNHEAGWVDEARKDGLIKNDETRSQYKVDRQKKAIDNGWKVTNTTPKGQEDQLFAYLDMARNPGDISAICGANQDVFKDAPYHDEFTEAVEKLLRYFEKQSAPAL